MLVTMIVYCLVKDSAHSVTTWQHPCAHPWPGLRSAAGELQSEVAQPPCGQAPFFVELQTFLLDADSDLSPPPPMIVPKIPETTKCLLSEVDPGFVGPKHTNMSMLQI